jgi:NitT/TauT family transport system substrate-binding protein
MSDKDVNFVSEDSGTSAYAALNNAQIDGAYVFAPFRQMGVDAGYAIFQYSGNVEGLASHPCCRNMVPTQELKTNRDSYVAYLRAMIKAYKFYQENHDKTVQDIVKYVQLDTTLISEETYGQHISSNPDPEYKSVKAWYDAMVSLNYVEQFDLDSGIDTSIYKDALDSIVSENPGDATYQSLEAHYQQYDQK